MPPQIIYDPTTQVPLRCLKVLCEDGKRRSATFTTKRTNHYHLPACVRVGTVWVSGWLTDNGEGDLLFFADPAGKNASHLPAQGDR